MYDSQCDGQGRSDKNLILPARWSPAFLAVIVYSALRRIRGKLHDARRETRVFQFHPALEAKACVRSDPFAATCKHVRIGYIRTLVEETRRNREAEERAVVAVTVARPRHPRARGKIPPRLYLFFTFFSPAGLPRESQRLSPLPPCPPGGALLFSSLFTF